MKGQYERLEESARNGKKGDKKNKELWKKGGIKEKGEEGRKETGKREKMKRGERKKKKEEGKGGRSN